MPDKGRRHATHEEPQTSFSSPPCYAHEVDPAYLGLVPALELDVAALHALKSTLDAAIVALRFIRFP